MTVTKFTWPTHTVKWMNGIVFIFTMSVFNNPVCFVAFGQIKNPFDAHGDDKQFFQDIRVCIFFQYKINYLLLDEYTWKYLAQSCSCKYRTQQLKRPQAIRALISFSQKHTICGRKWGEKSTNNSRVPISLHNEEAFGSIKTDDTADYHIQM